MTTRAEGLVTYTEETRVVRALAEGVFSLSSTDRVSNPNIFIIVHKQAFTPGEARALRDAITVMLGEESAKCAVCLEEDQETGKRIIARLEEASFHPLQGGPLVERRAAIAIVREECGVAE